MTVNASLTSWDMRYPPAPCWLEIVPARGFAKPSIRLVGRDDVPARIPFVLGVEDIVVRVHLCVDVGVTPAERRTGVSNRATWLIARRWRGRATAPASAAPATRRRAGLHRPASHRR